MKIGLVGFAGSGKTTVFNTMTGMDVPVGFGGEVRLGIVRVPDKRIDELSAVFSPKKTTYAEMSFCDVPGEHGAEKKGLSPRGLQQIRDQEALCLVLRDFVNPAIDGDPDPAEDLEAFHTECLFADLEIVERRLERAKKERAEAQEVAAFEVMKSTLEGECPLRVLTVEQLNPDYVRGYGLLTDRPLLVALNRNETEAGEPLPEGIAARLEELDAAGLVLSASVEAEIAGLEPEDQAAFLKDLGLSEPALARFIRTAYGLLDLISFFYRQRRRGACLDDPARDARTPGGGPHSLRSRAGLHPGGGDSPPDLHGVRIRAGREGRRAITGRGKRLRRIRR